ncbi:MAG: rod shape-determining protein MreC [Deltaproteobacteria bacterium]|nr:rod shape-determining protein MreC [Deltaproteobacteria bacterium]
MFLWRRYRDAFLCVVLLAVPFLFLNSNLKDPSRLNVLDRVILKISAPIQWVAAAVARGVSDVWEGYIYLVDVREESDALRYENARLREENHRFREAEIENRRLRRLLEFRESFQGAVRTAQVIAKDVLPPHFRVMRIRLDRGDRDDVRPGMPVVAHNGLVGQIRRSWGRYSDVLLTVDSKSSVDVMIERNGSRGILRGTGEADRYACRLEYLLRSDDVRVGDVVHTSGIGRRFPRGVLVGRISKVTRRDFGLYQEAEVTPSVDLSRLEEVLVLTTPPPEEPQDPGQTARKQSQ